MSTRDRRHRRRIPEQVHNLIQVEKLSLLAQSEKLQLCGCQRVLLTELAGKLPGMLRERDEGSVGIDGTFSMKKRLGLSGRRRRRSGRLCPWSLGLLRAWLLLALLVYWLRRLLLLLRHCYRLWLFGLRGTA